MKTYFIYPLLALGLFAITFSTNSCRKKADTIAKVTVRDTANILVPGATVILYGISTTEPKQPVARRDTVTTNSSGVATVNYNDVYQLGQAGVAVLNISAEKGDLYGEGIIKVEQEEESTATVFIQP
jgi:hypothetical protein